MIRKQNKLLPLIIVIFASGLHSSASAQRQEWRNIKGKSLVKFDWNCSTPAEYPHTKLNRIVRATMKSKKFGGAGTWGDRAFGFDLNGDRRPEYFIPLDCGATGNCTWGVFSLNPVRRLGLLGGQYIYVHRHVNRYPVLITYTHMSASEGVIVTYRFHRNQYVWLGDEYPTQVGMFSGNDIPAFLKKARAGCEKLGS